MQLIVDVVLAAAAAVVLGGAGAALLVRRSRRRAVLPPPSPGEDGSGFTCPFCRRDYDPARTGGRCPACGAAAPRR